MCKLRKGFRKIAHPSTTSREYYSRKQLALSADLFPDIVDYLLIARFYDLLQNTFFNAARMAQRYVFVGLILCFHTICRAIFQFQRFSFFLLNALAHNVGRHIATAQGDNDEMTQHTAVIHCDTGGVGAHIHERTARTFLAGREQCVGQADGRDKQLSHLKSGTLHALFDVLA